MAFNIIKSPKLWKAGLSFPKSSPITPQPPNGYTGGSAYNYSFPNIENWDCGSAETSLLPIGNINGGTA